MPVYPTKSHPLVSTMAPAPRRRYSQVAMRMLAALCALLLTHCAQVPKHSGTIDLSAEKQQLISLNHWQLEGKLGLRIPGNNGSARLHWSENPPDYELTLSGPLGQGRTTITGNNEYVRLTQADAPEQIATDAESLLREATGWELPVEQLRTWVKGIPAASEPASNERYSENGILEGFEQAGWELSFKRHQRVNGYLLPGHIVVRRPLAEADSEIRLILSIHQWEPFVD